VRIAAPTAVLLALLLNSASGAQPQTAADFAGALQRRYDAVSAFSADFVHTYRGGVLNRQLKESGRMSIKKPGRMRWEYQKPEEKLFVSDGSRIWFYVPQDRQVIVSPVPADDRASTPTLFLAGKGNLLRDFASSFTEVPADYPADSRALKLVPKSAQSDYDWLTLVVDGGTLALRGLVTVDGQGGTSSFSFTNLKENVKLADNAFVFRPPRGVDVVTDSSR
jgi:outer membrane lipoprotein carrier protein